MYKSLAKLGREALSTGLRAKSTVVRGKSYPADEWTNVPQFLAKLADRRLHKNDAHPVGIVRSLIEQKIKPLGFTPYNDFDPVVSTHANFDALGFPADHPGRSVTDTYYLNKDTLLRTHTSAHEIECFQTCKTPGYLITADVYRRDTIDRTHYPAFHQMEGARVWSRKEHGDKLAEVIRAELNALPKTNLVIEDPHPPFYAENPKQDNMTAEECELIGQHLKRTLELIMEDVFQRARESAIASGSDDPDLFKPLKARWIEATFPWTTPSWEIEIWWKGEWLEMCGCGVVKQAVLDNAGFPDKIGWAFGIGLERTAMILFGIPDIRLFWSQDSRFLSQFSPETVSTFKPWSKYPGITRDVAFWMQQGVDVHENDFTEIVRSTAGDLVENVSVVDEFTHPKTGRRSKCFRINYQAMDRNLTNDEINELQTAVESGLVSEFGVQIR
jgi:phenylalanyl-tRNA synthetase alpha chain